MKEFTMSLLVEVGESIGVDIRPYENYSGRFMYGRTTCGVVCSREGYVKCGIELAYQLGLKGVPPSEANEIMIEIAGTRIDNLGLDFIFY